MADEAAGPNAAKTGNGSDRETDDADSRELLNSANSAAGQARNAWLAFLGFLVYLVVAVGSVTHGDLLLDNPLTLPIADVEIPLSGFFWLAPFLLVLVHLSLLMQHAMLAHKYHHFTKAIAKSEGETPYSHADRRLVHSYVFAQLLAGQKPSIMLDVLMRLMIWITLSALPIATLLFFQVKFLAYHDVTVTWLQRVALLLDILLLIALPPLFCLPSLFRRRRTAITEWPSERKCLRWRPSFSGPGIEWGPAKWPWRVRWRSAVFGVIATLFVFSFSFLFAAVPGTDLDDLIAEPYEPTLRLASADLSRSEQAIHFDDALDGPGTERRPKTTYPCGWGNLLYTSSQPGFLRIDWGDWGYCLKTLLFDLEPDAVSSRPGDFFRTGRRLVFTDANAREAGLAEEYTFSLRGRELHEALLDQGPFERADLTGANLRAASLRGARLANAEIACADDLVCAEARNAAWNACYTAEDNDLECFEGRKKARKVCSKVCAKLQYADLQYADPTESDLEGADLKNANLRYATLKNAVLVDANLDGVDFANADLQGVKLYKTNLQELNLRGVADLKGADFSYANLQRANLMSVDLSGAYLFGADLRRANLRGANLRCANLRGADLRWADLRHADLQGADLRNIKWGNSKLERAKFAGATFSDDLKLEGTALLKCGAARSASDQAAQKELP